MKFYLIALDDGGMLYFPSMSSLYCNKYLLLEGHHCPIVNLSVSEDQNTFYTLGRTDKMLLEWRVDELKPISESNNLKITGGRHSHKRDWESMFDRMKKVS